MRQSNHNGGTQLATNNSELRQHTYHGGLTTQDHQNGGHHINNIIAIITGRSLGRLERLKGQQGDQEEKIMGSSPARAEDESATPQARKDSRREGAAKDRARKAQSSRCPQLERTQAGGS